MKYILGYSSLDILETDGMHGGKPQGAKAAALENINKEKKYPRASGERTKTIGGTANFKGRFGVLT